MMFLRITVLLSLLHLAAPLAAGQTGDLLTLDQAIAIALEDNPSVKNAAMDVESAQDQVAAARTRRLPSFSFYTLGSQQLSYLDYKFEKGVFGTFDGIGPIPATNTTIRSPKRFSVLMVNEISQPISQLYQIGLRVKQASIGVNLTKEQLRARQQAVTASVRTAYYSVLQTQSTLNVAQQNIRLYRELDRLTDEYVLQRVSLKSEALEVKTRLAKIELEALTLEDTLATQKEQLNGLLGRELQTAFSVSVAGDLERVSLELQQAQAKALAQRPEIRQARLKVDQAEADRRAKRAEYIPEVSLTFSHLSPISYSNILPNHIASAGVAVNWEIFDWGRKKHELAAKARSVEQATNTVTETESLVLREVNANYRKLQRTAQQVRIALLAQETATETQRVATNSYRADAALLKDVLQSEAAVAQANDQYQQALLSFWTVKSEFDKSLGEDQ